MPSASRAARELRRHDVVPVVDESLREINLDGVELPPVFATYDPRALLIGSSSKAYWGGLRVGWIRAPRDLVMPIVQARMMDDLGTSAFDQLVFAELLTEGARPPRRVGRGCGPPATTCWPSWPASSPRSRHRARPAA